jgi:uncharacterized delta-60 repeat protein
MNMRPINAIVLACAVQVAGLIQVYAAPGDVDLSFNAGPAPDGAYNSLAIQADGKILIGGIFTSVQGVARTNLARLNSSGLLDTNFLAGSAGPNQNVEGILSQADGKILIWGPFTSVNGTPREGLARLHPDGLLDETFLPTFGAPHGISSVALDRDGKILIGGSFSYVNGIARTNLARLNTDGSLDNSFLNGMSGPNAYVSSILIQNDTKILVAGMFTQFNGVSTTNVVRLNTNGTLDTGFVARFSTAFASLGPWLPLLGMQSDGKIVVGLGYYSDVPSSGEWCRVLRLNADGSADTSFSQAAGFNEGSRVSLYSLAVQSDDRILFGGYFATVNGVPRSNIARLDTDGTLDTSFDLILTLEQFHPGIDQILLQEDGKILIGGWFTAINGTARNSLARLLGGPYFFNAGASPPSQTAEIGAYVEFGIDATGYTAPAYQWFFNNSSGPVGTNSVLRLTQVSTLNAGAYKVIVTNSVGGMTSSPAMLNVITPVERRIVPAVKLFGDSGSLLHLESISSLDLPHNWQPLADVTLSGTSGYYFELVQPLPPQRFIHARQTAPVAMQPYCQMTLVPAITLSGQIDHSIRVDYINQIGPTDAWVTLDTVTLTNSSQLYFDVSAPGQPVRLYRLVPLP